LLADVYAMQGRTDEARALFERVLGTANDLGLLSEESWIEDGRAVGNFPQALSHVAVVNTALSISCGGRPPRLPKEEAGD
jgi:GH15 family glucan-1,4-alpha-glucosidase